MSYENNALAFAEINPDTGKRWTCNELFTALTSEREQRVRISNELDQVRLGPDVIISWPEQSANLRARWAIHLDEFSIARKQLTNLGAELRKQFDQYRDEFNNFSVLKKS